MDNTNNNPQSLAEENSKQINDMFDEFVVSKINSNTTELYKELKNNLGIDDDKTLTEVISETDKSVKSLRRRLETLLGNGGEEDFSIYRQIESLGGDVEAHRSILETIVNESAKEEKGKLDAMSAEFRDFVSTNNNSFADTQKVLRQISDVLDGMSSDADKRRQAIVLETNKKTDEAETAITQAIKEAHQSADAAKKELVNGLQDKATAVTEEIKKAQSEANQSVDAAKTEVINGLNETADNLAETKDALLEGQQAMKEHASGLAEETNNKLESDFIALKKLVYILLAVDGVSLAGIITMIVLFFLK